MRTMRNTESIGQRIKRERLKKSLTQRELAWKVEVGTPHILKVEAGRESPSDELLKKLRLPWIATSTSFS